MISKGGNRVGSMGSTVRLNERGLFFIGLQSLHWSMAVRFSEGPEGHYRWIGGIVEPLFPQATRLGLTQPSGWMGSPSSSARMSLCRT